MPKVDPFYCVHRTLHPGRFDGSRTVCLDCEQTVHICEFVYASNKPARQQYEEALALLEAEKDVLAARQVEAAVAGRDKVP